MALAADATLDEVRAHLGPLIAANAGFDGWSAAARDMAADQAGVDRDIAALAFTEGAPAMITAWFDSIDAAMVAALPKDRLATMKIRARIREQICARLEIMHPHRDALRRAHAVLAMPGNVALGARLGWRAADLMWRQAGDTATDYNHYTKRALLAGIYAATVTVFLGDETSDWADTRAFLDRRIDGIMRFEKLKSGFVERSQNLPSLSRFIGRLRYPAA
ncbi:COQ9 family protein [Sphingomonas sp.]|uniref:COQ9 family protein n=1 Tax=Sphingomonas sp. TaxID=28214 RepID=UPI001DA71A95|nr:COQ9 family protein [Sphingomonas sp.]MBX9795551.1 COQ9 family protein [Sphingomonas sp.]